MSINIKNIIKLIYLYLFSLVGLVLVIVASVSLIELGLKTLVFKNADQAIIYPERPIIDNIETMVEGDATSKEDQEEYEKKLQQYEEQNRQRERQRTASNSIAMLIVGIPLFMYHWRQVRKEG